MNVEQARAWWQRWQVIVGALGIVAALIAGVWRLADGQATLQTGVSFIRGTSEDLVRQATSINEGLRDLGVRVTRLETAKEEQARNIMLFWEKDWRDLRARVERIEQKIIGGAQLRERQEDAP